LVFYPEPGRPGGGSDEVLVVEFVVFTVLPFWATWKVLDWSLERLKSRYRPSGEPEFRIIEIEESCFSKIE